MTSSVDIQLVACVLIFLSSLAAFLITMALVSNTTQATALTKELSRLICCWHCTSLLYSRGEDSNDNDDDDDDDACNRCNMRWIYHQCEATIEMATHECQHHHHHQRVASSDTSPLPCADNHNNYQTHSSHAYATSATTTMDNRDNNIDRNLNINNNHDISSLPPLPPSSSSLLLDHHHHHDHPHDTIRNLYEADISTSLVLIRCMAAGIILGILSNNTMNYISHCIFIYIYHLFVSQYFESIIMTYLSIYIYIYIYLYM